MNEAVGEIGRSRKLRALLMFTGLVYLVWVLANWIVSGSTQNLVMGGLIIAMVMITVSILNDWKSGFFLFILWLLLEDLARKYMGNNMVVYFGKDVLAAITYVSFIVAKRRQRRDLRTASFRPVFLIPLVLFFGIALVQVFNPESPNVLYGLLGMKLYFYYIPLMFIGYGLIENGRELDRFLLFSVVLGFVIGFLGIMQSVLGLKFLNPASLAPELEGLGNLTRVSPITGHPVPVPTSVFVSGGRFAIYMILVIILALGTQAYILLTRRRGAIYGFIGVGLALVAAMQSGSRGSIIYTVMSALVVSTGLLWGAPWRWGQGSHIIKAFRRSVIIGVAGMLLMIQLFPDSIGATWSFYYETLSPYSPASELRNRTWDYPVDNFLKAFQFERWPIGYGTGTASLGMQYVERLLGQERHSMNVVENGYGTLVIEMGIFGLLLWILWTGVLLASAWKIVLELRQTVYFPVGFAIFWYCFLLLVPFTFGGISPYQNFVMNAYLWTLVGVLFKLPHLARTPQMVPENEKVPKLVGVPAFARGR